MMVRRESARKPLSVAPDRRKHALTTSSNGLDCDSVCFDLPRFSVRLAGLWMLSSPFHKENTGTQGDPSHTMKDVGIEASEF